MNGVVAAYRLMVRQGFGHIVNTASMAAFMATPMAGPYGATKAAVASLSRGLRLEAAHFGVRVSALCPGVIRTPILVDGGRYGRVASFLDSFQQSRMWERLRPMDPALFARRTLDEVARNRAVIVVPRWWRAIRFLNGFAPGFADRVASRQLTRDLAAARVAPGLTTRPRSASRPAAPSARPPCTRTPSGTPAGSTAGR